MPFQVSCPNCSNVLEIPESLLGKQARCASCQQVFIIGKPQTPAGAPQTPASAQEVRISTTKASRQIAAAVQPPVLLRPAPEPPPPRRPRRPSRTKIPPVVWIVGGCAIGVFCMIALALVGLIIYRISSSSDAKPNTMLQVDVRPGEFVAQNAATELLILGNTRPLHVRVDIDEADIPRLRPGSRVQGFLRGWTDRSVALDFVRVEPYVVAKRWLTGDNTERVDTRALQVIYAVDDVDPAMYVGEQVDVFIDSGDAPHRFDEAIETGERPAQR